MEISEQAVSLMVPTIGMAVVAAVARVAHRSWLAPGPFFALFWLAITLASAAFAPSYPNWAGGLWLILFFDIALCLGAEVGQTRRNTRPDTENEVSWRTRHFMTTIPQNVNRKMARFTAGAVIVGGLAILLVMNAAGISATALLSYDRLARAASDLAWRRYTTGFTEPLPAQLCLCGIYLGALVGGALWGFSRETHHKLLAAAPLFVALLYTSVVAARATFCFAAVFFISVSLCVTVYKHPTAMLLMKTKRIIAMALGTSILFCVFAGVQHLRDSRYASLTTDNPASHIRLYFCGSLSSFSLWTQDHFAKADPPTWGAYSVAGVFQLLNIKERKLGLYRDFIQLGGPVQTNIYTMFRGLISDFTAVGAALVLAIFGLISGRSYVRVRAGDLYHLPLLACFYATTICGLATSLFNYNTLIVAFVAFHLLCSSVTNDWMKRGIRFAPHAAESGSEVLIRACRSVRLH